MASIADERDAIEASFRDRIGSSLNASDLDKATYKCWREADDVERRWKAKLAASPVPATARTEASRLWARLSARAGL